jgi:endonuclease/exonuclease/phosphatase (EEP) superfamily protein YafD
MHKTPPIGRKLTVFVMATLATMCGACSAASSTTTDASTFRVRVGTYNMMGGRKPAKILANLRKLDADLLCLQEVSSSQTQLKMYARALGMKAAFAPYRPAGSSGVAILANGSVTIDHTFTMDGERAFGVAAKVRLRGQELYVICVHLKSLPRPLMAGALASMEARSKQAREIVAWAQKQTVPTIIAGDCNSLTFFPEYLTLSNAFVDACRQTKTQHEPTIFVSGMGYRIDHIFATNGAWRVAGCSAPALAGSDHRPVVAELGLSPTPTSTPKPASQPAAEADKK